MADETKILLQAVQEAGDAILNLQKKGMKISHKDNQDILTEADILANEILKKTLLGQFPQDGWLSEETIDDANRLHCQRVWVVDPIDGTREFAQGLPEYAISVALVEAGVPILGVVHNPAKNELYYAVQNQGAWLGKKQLHCKAELSGRNLCLLASRSEYARGEWNKIEQQYEVKQIGSIAYKLALVAKGYAQATFSLGPKNEWDIAAGVLLIEEAGGKVSNKYQERIKFNQACTKIKGILACAKENYAQVLALIAAQA